MSSLFFMIILFFSNSLMAMENNKLPIEGTNYSCSQYQSIRIQIGQKKFKISSKKRDPLTKRRFEKLIQDAENNGTRYLLGVILLKVAPEKYKALFCDGNELKGPVLSKNRPWEVYFFLKDLDGHDYELTKENTFTTYDKKEMPPHYKSSYLEHAYVSDIVLATIFSKVYYS